MAKEELEEIEAENAQFVNTEIVPTNSTDNQISFPASNMMEHRDELIKQHHGAATLAEKLGKQGKNSTEEMVIALVSEIIKETDLLLGNHLLAGEAGNLQLSSIISAKRAEVIEKAIKALQTKQVIEKDKGINVDSPEIKYIFKFFMKKIKVCFEKLDYKNEASDVFFRTFSESMQNWNKELKQELEDSSLLTTTQQQQNVQKNVSININI